VPVSMLSQLSGLRSFVARIIEKPQGGNTDDFLTNKNVTHNWTQGSCWGVV